MIKGMTGFGCAAFSSGKIKGVLEIKSLNHRYLDINFYLPIGFASIENRIREILQKTMERGRVSISIKITNKPAEIVDFNREAVKKYLHYAQILKKEFGFHGELGLSDLIKLPGVVDVKESLVSGEEMWGGIEVALKKALADLNVMRKREGQSLVKDISAKLKEMKLLLKNIHQRGAAILKEKRKLLNDEEFGSFQKGNDVNEELARLRHYIEEFGALVKNDVALGKKLDFIAQEMLRETNTIGSKLQDKTVSNAVISLKSKIEKIREQSQNIE